MNSTDIITYDLEAKFELTPYQPKTQSRKKVFAMLGMLLGVCGVAAYD